MELLFCRVYLQILIISILKEVTDSCSENCLVGKSHCDSSTGSCWYGCKPGWSGDQCQNNCSIPDCLECYHNENNTEICDRCKIGWYGDHCENTCNDKCLSSRCNAVGDCVFGCKSHWTGKKCNEQYCNFEFCLQCGFSSVYYIPICTKCIEGKFYSYGENKCVNCSDKCIGGNSECNQTTGICYNGCEKGFYGTNCDRVCSINHCDQCVLAKTHGDTAKCGRCSQGWYPSNLICTECSLHCNGGISNCNGSTGHCLEGCTLGWFGALCNKQCQISNCHICADDHFGKTYCKVCNTGMYFDYSSGSCLNCSDHCIGGRLACDKDTGKCPKGCYSGYHGEKCQYVCGNCKGQSCFVNGTCPSGCENGWFNEYCSQKFPEHCSDSKQFLKNGTCGDCQAYWYGAICDKKCNANCRPSDYNGYVYCNKHHGKCDSGCLPGYYGDTCSNSCNENCNYRNCHQTTGTCTNGCEFKFYGDYCNKSCPKNCDQPGCNPTTGQCSGECYPGFYGDHCQMPCSNGCKGNKCYKVQGGCSNLDCNDGYYGNKCDVNCSENCLQGICDRFDGKCSKGCLEGFYGQYCGYECKGCQNATCTQEDGTCVYGCLEGMDGQSCNEVCSSGTYGVGCKLRCTSCRDQSCDAKTGVCQFGCAVGFTGPLCQDEVPLYSGGIMSNEKDNIAVATSASVSVVLTIAVIVAACIIVRKKKNFSLCSKTKKRRHDDSPGEEIQTIQTHSQEETIDPADLQLYPVIVTGQRFEIKFGKYCSTFRSSPVMVRILPNGSNSTDCEDFYRDAAMLKELPKQKNVVFFFGIGTNLGYSFSVFELCSRGVMLSYLRNLTESCRDHTSTILKRNLLDLMKCCLDVVSGMEYLLHKKILHRHISANDIFLDENKRSKIGNLFYAVNIESETEELQSTKLPDECLPWMAAESIQECIFSSKSEIYSFGVFLWEVLSLGEDAGIVKSKLSEGELLPKPDCCERSLYRLMIRCWNEEQHNRPTLQYIYQHLSDTLDNTEESQDQIDVVNDVDEDYTMRSTAV
ncbi:multiple epidermal growth factor-like domains protein 10 isoform X1 [Mytilus californianus]|uniref:multiple epidermal growth factor-like domains protein 10 isoform X1 n=2 Tax=Mytilus californianus TaxID=6549 RepID=UPI0022464A20|nr:multiple epidermal growth factor-like domains protein 10 isoform X1 [Mytilus californianus]